MKYEFDGIGETTAHAALAALATTPLAWFAIGIPGKITYYIFKYLFMNLASSGLIVMNLGIAKVEVLIEKESYDGSWDTAEKAIDDVSKTRELTLEEKRTIDEPVKAAFRKFARFSRVRPSGDTGAKP